MEIFGTTKFFDGGEVGVSDTFGENRSHVSNKLSMVDSSNYLLTCSSVCEGNVRICGDDIPASEKLEFRYMKEKNVSVIVDGDRHSFSKEMKKSLKCRKRKVKAKFGRVVRPKRYERKSSFCVPSCITVDENEGE